MSIDQQNKEAYAWATSNMKDPRAPKVLEKIGVINSDDVAAMDWAHTNLPDKRAPKIIAKVYDKIAAANETVGDKVLKGVVAFASPKGESVMEKIPVVGGLGRALGERFRAGVDTAINLGDTGKGYSERLKDIQTEREQSQAEFARENPGAETARNIAGAVGGMAVIPTFGKNATGLAGAATRTAGAVGTSVADKALQGGNTDELKQAALLSGTIQVGLEAIPAIGKLKISKQIADKIDDGLKSISQKLDSISAFRAVKAATGQNKRELVKMARTKGIEETGEILTSPNEFLGKPLVGFGDSVNKIKEKADDAAEKVWDAIEGIYKNIDDVTAGKSVDGAYIGKKILEKASNIEPVPQNQAIIDKMLENAAYFEKKGAMSLSEAQKLKNNFIFKLDKPQTHALGLDGNNQIRAAITESMGDSIGAVSKTAKETWQRGMDLYGGYSSIAGAANDRAIANFSNRFISPSDYAAGLAVGGAKVLKGAADREVIGGLWGLLTSIGHKIIRERGSSMASVSARNAAEILRTKPQALGKFLNVLTDAARKSPAALEATHLMLLKDPEYQKTLGIEQEMPNGFNLFRNKSESQSKPVNGIRTP